jgi:hypothetical protein
VNKGNMRFLFIGNSLTYWAGGLDSTFRQWGHEAVREVQGGATLLQLWMNHKFKNKIKEGCWDVVVLQDYLPEYPGNREPLESFGEAVASFAPLVRSIEAKPLIYMAYAYSRIKQVTQRDIYAAHKVVQNEQKIEVAPCGLGHAIARARGFCLDLLDKDREQPSVAGAYLNALIIAATILGEFSPELVWVPDSLFEEHIQSLKSATCEALLEWGEFVSGERELEDLTGSG